MKITFTEKERKMISGLKSNIKNADGNIDVGSVSEKYKGISIENNEVNFSEELVCDFLEVVEDIVTAVLGIGPIIKLVFKDVIKKGKRFEDKWEVKADEKQY